MIFNTFNLPVETPDSVEGLVVIIFSAVAAMISVFLERRKNNKKTTNTEITLHPDRFLDKAFEELQKTTHMLREENKTLMEYNAKLGRVIDEYRKLYSDQLEANSDIMDMNRIHLSHIEKLNEKVDELLKIIQEKVCPE